MLKYKIARTATMFIVAALLVTWAQALPDVIPINVLGTSSFLNYWSNGGSWVA